MSPAIATKSGASVGTRCWAWRAGRIGLFVFGLILVLGAALKAHEPDAAVVQIGRIVPWRPMRCAVLGLLIGFEAVAGLLAMVAWSRTTRRTLLLFVVSAVLFRMWMLGRGDMVPCGCFGDVDVPPAALWGILALGGLVAGITPYPVSPRRLAFARWLLLSTVLGVAVVATRRSCWWQDPAAQIIDAVRMHGDVPAIVMVGSWDCAHCIQVLGEIEEARSSESSSPRTNVVFIVRESESGRAVTGRPTWTTSIAVPDDLWWSAILDRPPTFVVHDDRGDCRLSNSWR